jgi:hypothetical protein
MTQNTAPGMTDSGSVRRRAGRTIGRSVHPHNDIPDHCAQSRRLLAHDHQRRAPVERLVAHLHSLGPRAFAEFLDELAMAHGIVADILARLELYAHLRAEQLSACRGDRFAPAPVRAIGGRQ